MSNALAIFQDSNANTELAPAFHALANTDMGGDLSGGVGGNYAIVSMKGSKWRIKHHGNETMVTLPNGDPQMSLEVVIVKANGYLTKQYYAEGYTDGAAEAPSCFSVDGKVPAAQVENPVHDKCATCPMNAFGSRITEAGTKAKACQDNRKIAVTPLNDLRNEALGGPMLFRVPPSALKDLASFGQMMQSRGYPYNSVAVRIGFDPDVSHPKPTFRAIRPLTNDEAEVVLELANSDLVERVLADFGSAAAAPAAEAPPADDAFEQPPTEAVAPKQPPPPVAKPAAAKPAAKPAAPAAGAAQPKAPAPTPKPAAKAATPAAAVKVPGPPAARKAAPAAAAATPANDVPASLQGAEITDAEVVPDAAPAPETGGLDDEINNILAGLNAVG